MLVSIQFPLVDSRNFIAETHKVTLSHWPNPNQDEFVHFFGSLKIRPNRGLKGWLNEDVVCEASRALTFEGNINFNKVNANSTAKTWVALRCAYRRFFSTGVAAKFEVGLATKQRERVDLDETQLLALLEHFLGLPVKVRTVKASPNLVLDPPAKNALNLARAGKALAELYLAASTSYPYLLTADLPGWWVRCGPPLLYLEYSNKDALKFPIELNPIELPSDYGFQLCHCLVNYKFIMYVVSLSSSANLERLRQLRLYLFRLHAENEALKHILENIKDKKINLNDAPGIFKTFEFYLKKAIEGIGKYEEKSVNHFSQEVVDLARMSGDAISLNRHQAIFDLLDELELSPLLKKNAKEHVKMLGAANTYIINLTNVEGSNININSKLNKVSQKIKTAPTRVVTEAAPPPPINSNNSSNEDVTNEDVTEITEDTPF